MLDYYNVEVEVWKDLPGYSAYQISNIGRVRSCWKRGAGQKFYIVRDGTWKIRRPAATHYGYPGLTIYDDNHNVRNVNVHTLVLEAFVGPRPEGMEALHGNGVVNDNRVDNLRWGTKSENELDKIAHGRDRKGSKHPLAKLNESQILEIRDLRSGGMTQQKIANRFGVSRSLIGLICTGVIWQHI